MKDSSGERTFCEGNLATLTAVSRALRHFRVEQSRNHRAPTNQNGSQTSPACCGAGLRCFPKMTRPPAPPKTGQSVTTSARTRSRRSWNASTRSALKNLRSLSASQTYWTPCLTVPKGSSKKEKQRLCVLRSAFKCPCSSNGLLLRGRQLVISANVMEAYKHPGSVIPPLTTPNELAMQR